MAENRQLLDSIKKNIQDGLGQHMIELKKTNDKFNQINAVEKQLQKELENIGAFKTMFTTEGKNNKQILEHRIKLLDQEHDKAISKFDSLYESIEKQGGDYNKMLSQIDQMEGSDDDLLLYFKSLQMQQSEQVDIENDGLNTQKEILDALIRANLNQEQQDRFLQDDFMDALLGRDEEFESLMKDILESKPEEEKKDEKEKKKMDGDLLLGGLFLLAPYLNKIKKFFADFSFSDLFKDWKKKLDDAVVDTIADFTGLNAEIERSEKFFKEFDKNLNEVSENMKKRSKEFVKAEEEGDVKAAEQAREKMISERVRAEGMSEIVKLKHSGKFKDESMIPFQEDFNIAADMGKEMMEYADKFYTFKNKQDAEDWFTDAIMKKGYDKDRESIAFKMFDELTNKLSKHKARYEKMDDEQKELFALKTAKWKNKSLSDNMQQRLNELQETQKLREKMATETGLEAKDISEEQLQLERERLKSESEDYKPSVRGEGTGVGLPKKSDLTSKLRERMQQKILKQQMEDLKMGEEVTQQNTVQNNNTNVVNNRQAYNMPENNSIIGKRGTGK